MVLSEELLRVESAEQQKKKKFYKECHRTEDSDAPNLLVVSPQGVADQWHRGLGILWCGREGEEEFAQLLVVAH